MRARQRHFNARDAGASGVYDARFISGLANDATVGTWSSRTNSNDATQSTEANKPLYKTNQLNGNPVVQYDGSNDQLTFAKLDATSAWVLIVVKRTGANTFQNVISIQKVAGTAHTFQLGLHNDVPYGPVIFGNTSGSWAKGSTLKQNEWRSLYLVWLGGGSSGSQYYNGWDNGDAITLSNSSNVGASGNTTSFLGEISFGGQIALVVFALTDSTNPLRKRISHSAAYSFKMVSS